MNIRRRAVSINQLLVGLICVSALSGRAWSDTVHVNGFEMYYEIVGEGEPLILLHGGSGTGSMMKTRYADLGKDFRMIVPDLRGHGRSPDATGDLSPRQAALDVFALLDHLGLDRVKAFGGSYGSAILLHMATQQPERLEAMVLGAVGAKMSEQGRDLMRSFDASTMPESLRRAHVQGDDQIDALLSRFGNLVDDPKEFVFDDVFLSTISASTLIVTGDRDEFNPAGAALELYEAIPNSYLWIVPNGSHAALLMDEGLHDFFMGVATPFLRGEWGAGGGGAPDQ